MFSFHLPTSKFDLYHVIPSIYFRINAKKIQSPEKEKTVHHRYLCSLWFCFAPKCIPNDDLISVITAYFFFISCYYLHYALCIINKIRKKKHLFFHTLSIFRTPKFTTETEGWIKQCCDVVSGHCHKCFSIHILSCIIERKKDFMYHLFNLHSTCVKIRGKCKFALISANSILHQASPYV